MKQLCLVLARPVHLKLRMDDAGREKLTPSLASCGLVAAN